MVTYAAYRIGWWTHRWWPRRALVVGLLTGQQASPRADNGSRFVGRRVIARELRRQIVRDLRMLRRPHRPWQAEASDLRFARRAFTAPGAEHKIETDVEHQRRYGHPSPWQHRQMRRAR